MNKATYTDKANKEYLKMLHDRDMAEVDAILHSMEVVITSVAAHLAHADMDVLQLLGNPVLEAGEKCGEAWDAIEAYRCALGNVGKTDKKIVSAFEGRKDELSCRGTFQAAYQQLRSTVRKNDRKKLRNGRSGNE